MSTSRYIGEGGGGGGGLEVNMNIVSPVLEKVAFVLDLSNKVLEGDRTLFLQSKLTHKTIQRKRQ